MLYMAEFYFLDTKQQLCNADTASHVLYFDKDVVSSVSILGEQSFGLWKLPMYFPTSFIIVLCRVIKWPVIALLCIGWLLIGIITMSYKKLQRCITYIINIASYTLLTPYIMKLLMHKDEAKRKSEYVARKVTPSGKSLGYTSPNLASCSFWSVGMQAPMQRD